MADTSATSAAPDGATMLCRACRSRNGEIVLDLGRQPSGEEMAPFDSPEPEPVLPLRLWLCHDCGLAQLHGDAIGTGTPRPSNRCRSPSRRGAPSPG